MTDIQSDTRIEPRYALIASMWAIVTVVVLIVIKTIAYMQSGSAAVLGTLTDSLTDAAISVMMLIALRYSLRPADRDHRHGHGKMEGVAALFQAAFLSGAGLFLTFEALRRFEEPQEIIHHMTGIWVAGITILLSILLVVVQGYCLKRAPSLAISSDRAHYTTDILLNGSVIFSLLINMNGGPAWVDTACALGIAFFYFILTRKIGLEAVDMLMDKELPEAVRNRIKDIIKRHPDILGFHDLRTRKSGMTIHISFDVEVDPEIPLREAHEYVRALENDILADYPYAEIIIHKDPFGDTDDARHPIIKGQRA